jgi:beta-mannosidase
MSEPGVYASPGEIPADTETVPAIVPGTVAAALEAAGRFDRNNPEPLIDKDAWYLHSLANEAPGPAMLRFEGLATIAEVYLDNRLILSSDSMFESHDITVDLTGTETLSICLRALKRHLEKIGPRARWRPRLMNNQGLRLIRTTALGFMPGWSQEIHAVGPWRPVLLARPTDAKGSSNLPFSHPAGEDGWGTVSAYGSIATWEKELSFSASLSENGTGVLKVSFPGEQSDHSLHLVCAGKEIAFTYSEGRYTAELHLPNIEPWWPHTHGEPRLHDVTLRIDAVDHLLARTGFRRIEVDCGMDGESFGLVVNGEDVFCRGSVWTTADILRLPGNRNSYEPRLRLARDAGMNMIRIPGIAVYESREFFALCDELGLMVWQDFMFANFDYPVADPGFLIHVKTEATQFLKATQHNPSLAVLCGGSEIWQQGAMLGLPERSWKGPLCTEVLAGMAAEERPDLPYVANSPSGGALPFYPNAGIAHYYGVGGYLRPLDDARRANIRFAAECLAFSNMSQTERLEGGKSGVPRDAGADWDFEDVRDHYVGVLYGVDAKTLRDDDFERYLALSRAATGEVMEATYAEWRRSGSSCKGALTFTFQDVMPGPGWGVIDVQGKPKPTWYALKRAFRPLQITLSDEGTNGLDLHIVNETPAPLPAILELSCFRDGRTPVVSARRELTLEARSSRTLAATDLFGAFFDTTYAYRFGPPAHDVTVARLKHAETGELVADAFHFPQGRAGAFHDAEIAATLTADADGYWLELEADRLAQSIAIDVPGFRASDNWFHLAPKERKQVHLTALEGMKSENPSGRLRALGSGRIFRF